MAAMLNGAGALAFAGRLFGVGAEDLEREAALDYRRPGQTLFLPYLSGERTPHDDPNARGVYFGLDNSTSRADVARATMEGVAFALADARDCVESGAAPLGDVGLIGGGAKSALWTRMIAAALERPVVRYRGRRDRPGVRRGAARAARGDRRSAEDLCRPPEIADETEPDPTLVAPPSQRAASGSRRSMRAAGGVSGSSGARPVSRRRRLDHQNVEHKRAVGLDREMRLRLRLAATSWSARIVFIFSSGVRMRAVQTGKSILSRKVRKPATAKPARSSASIHCRKCSRAHGSVAQQFDRLQVGVEQRRAGRKSVDEHRAAAAFQNAARLPEPGLKVAPMMRGESGGHEIETGVIKGEALGRGLGGLDIGQALFARCLPRPPPTSRDDICRTWSRAPHGGPSV